jgi:hypothetical protein
MVLASRVYVCVSATLMIRAQPQPFPDLHPDFLHACKSDATIEIELPEFNSPAGDGGQFQEDEPSASVPQDDESQSSSTALEVNLQDCDRIASYEVAAVPIESVQVQDHAEESVTLPSDSVQTQDQDLDPIPGPSQPVAGFGFLSLQSARTLSRASAGEAAPASLLSRASSRSSVAEVELTRLRAEFEALKAGLGSVGSAGSAPLSPRGSGSSLLPGLPAYEGLQLDSTLAESGQAVVYRGRFAGEDVVAKVFHISSSALRSFRAEITSLLCVHVP